KPVLSLRRPEALDEYYKLPTGTAGMETLVLLARETPLPANGDLRAGRGTFGQQTGQDIRAGGWVENGKEGKGRPRRGGGGGRGGRFDAAKIDDPVLITQQRINDLQKKQFFSYTRAVSFANQGK